MNEGVAVNGISLGEAEYCEVVIGEDEQVDDDDYQIENELDLLLSVGTGRNLREDKIED